MDKADQSIETLMGIMQSENNELLTQYVTKELYANIDPVTAKISDLIDIQLAEAEAGATLRRK